MLTDNEQLKKDNDILERLTNLNKRLEVEVERSKKNNKEMLEIINEINSIIERDD